MDSVEVSKWPKVLIFIYVCGIGKIWQRVGEGKGSRRCH